MASGRRIALAVTGGLILVVAVATPFVLLGLDAADKIASVVGALVGVIALVSSAYGSWTHRARTPDGTPPAADPPPAPGRHPLPDAAGTAAPHGLVRIPRLPARVFAGRQQQLDQLDADRSLLVLCGLGGVGKSELVLQHAHRHRADHAVTWWVEASSAERIRAGLGELTRAIVPQGSHATVDDAASWALTWLAAHAGWLLVLDDVGDLADVEPLLGRLGGGRIIITTRRSTGWDRFARPVVLDVLGSDDGAAVLAAMADPRPTEDAELAGLAENLGGLPLALTQAGAYIARTPGMTAARYRHLLRAAPGRIHAAATPGSTERVIADVWQVTHEHLAVAEPFAMGLLDLLACFAPDDLPIDVVAGADADGEPEVTAALAVLASYCMINTNGDAVSVHRLVAATTLHRLASPQRATLLARSAALLDAALPPEATDAATWPRWARLVPHVLAVLPATCPGVARTVEYLEAVADYAPAVALQRRIVEHDPTLDGRHRLARLTGQQGDAAAARDQHAALLAESVAERGPRHPETLAVRAGLAEWTGEAGDRQRALELYEHLLPDLREVRGDDDPVTIHARMDHANWVVHLGDADRARALFSTVLPIAEAALGPDHPESLTLRGCLAYATGRAGDAPGARDLYRRLLEQRRRTDGPDHPETLATARDLATWTAVAGDPVAARDQLADLLPRLDRAWGPRHPNETLPAKELHADLTGRAGDPARARELLAELLAVRVQVSGPDHPLTGQTRLDLARWSDEPAP